MKQQKHGHIIVLGSEAKAYAELKKEVFMPPPSSLCEAFCRPYEKSVTVPNPHYFN